MVPRKSEYVFNSDPKVLETYFPNLRKRLAQRLSNPRLKEIHFHTIRHWKATMLYHQTKDILYVKEFLGHKRLDSTLIYINMEKALFYKGNPKSFTLK
ncbi:site-specific integrase [Candidatus Bathyarchaeota archaeon]|nr:site-specific integrase [Candidatus Bathyarchaeota archaeon]